MTALARLSPGFSAEEGAALWRQDRDHALHPWTEMDRFPKEGALVIARGEGAYLWDASGQRYLDAVGGLWCTNIGLGRREMAEAIGAQALQLAYASGFVDMTNAPAAQLVAKLASLAPAGLSRVHLTTGGSTAVDTAVRMAGYVQACRGFPQKRGIVARDHSYHGSTFLAQSVGKRPGDRVPEFHYLEEGIYHLSCPNPYRRPAGMSEGDFTQSLLAEFEALIARVGAERLGAFIAEPIQASGGVIVPPEGYLQGMAALCRKHGILIIADEVVTGFGRLGHWFAMEAEFGVRPDIICAAKGLTSGYQPLGAVIFAQALWEDMANAPGRWFTSGYTYSGHPVACAAALKAIEITEREGLLERAARIGRYFEARLAPLADLPLIGQVRGRKLMICVESVADKDSKIPLPDEAREAKRIADACEAMGLLVRPMGHLNVMSPPLTLAEAEVDFIAETLEKAIRRVTDDVVREGYKIGG